MPFPTTVRRALPLLVLASCCLLPFSAGLLAKGKPGGGGGGGGNGDSVPAGTIYWELEGEGLINVMIADGSDKATLPGNVYGQPSQQTHGGHRWFLDVNTIPGEFYPDGGPRVELFAVRDDGDESVTVQLTSDPALEINPRRNFLDRINKVRWAPLQLGPDLVMADAVVSFEAVAWDLEAEVPLIGGIYEAMIECDGDGNVLGLVTQVDPVRPLVELAVHPDDRDHDGVIDDWRTQTFGFDWSPDGTALVWGGTQSNGPSILYVVDLLTQNPVSVPIAELQLNSNPRWSPDGSKIAVAVYDGIATLSPDGSSFELIVSSRGGRSVINTLGSPVWSPDGRHLVYSHFEWNQNNGTIFRDLFRVTSSGRNKTNLTPDVEFDPRAIQWR